MPANVPFTFDLDGKGADASVTELQDGDLLIEGWGANYDIDREDEAFEEGAFRNALSKFLAGNAPLCYHHKMDTVIGKVVSAEPVAGKGIKLRAIVDKQNEASPYHHIYDGIKRGRINGLSCGGIFKRDRTKNKIVDVDLLEWSATPVSVGRGTNFSVIAGKAMELPFEGKAEDDPRKDEENGGEPRTGTPPTPAEPEPKPTEEEVVKEKVEEVKNEAIPAGSITGETIASGSITTEHLADDLRSRFQELTPEQTQIEDLAEALTRLDASLGKVANHVGIAVDKPSEDKTTA